MSTAPTIALSVIGLIAIFLVLGSLLVGFMLLRRRNFRFSLAALLLFVLAASMICGAVAYHVRTVRDLRAQLIAARDSELAARELAERERARAEMQAAAQQAN